MNILLSGYFDKNLGDDVMQKLVVQAFPEHNFYINFASEEMLTHLDAYKNVFFGDNPKIDVFLNVIGTGFMYSGKRAKLEKLLSMFSKKANYPKSALINCSLENFDSKLAEKFALYDLRKYSLITCRDKKSYSFLKDKVKSATVKCFEDMVYSTSVPDALNEGVLGIAPVRRLYSSENFNYYKELALLADKFIEEKNKNVLLFAFDNGLENDLSAVFSVRDFMEHKDRAELILYSSDSDYVINNMARCSYFVGSRFHSIVLSTLLKITSLAVYDREKLIRLSKEENIPAIAKKDLKAQEALNLLFSHKHEPKSHIDAQGHINALREFLK